MSPTQLLSAQRPQGPAPQLHAAGNRRQQRPLRPPQNPNRGSQGPAKLAKAAGARGCGQHLCSSAAQLTSLPHPPESSFLCCGQQRSRSHPLRDGGSAPGRPHRELRAQPGAAAPARSGGSRGGSGGNRAGPLPGVAATPRAQPRLLPGAGPSSGRRPEAARQQRGRGGGERSAGSQVWRRGSGPERGSAAPTHPRGASRCFRPRPTARRA